MYNSHRYNGVASVYLIRPSAQTELEKFIYINAIMKVKEKRAAWSEGASSVGIKILCCFAVASDSRNWLWLLESLRYYPWWHHKRHFPRLQEAPAPTADVWRRRKRPVDSRGSPTFPPQTFPRDAQTFDGHSFWEWNETLFRMKLPFLHHPRRYLPKPKDPMRRHRGDNPQTTSSWSCD